jgi:enamine deaminase RidA (YjgF/YER057c/UK114 family)
MASGTSTRPCFEASDLRPHLLSGAPYETREADVTIKRYETSAVYSKMTEANGFIFTAGVIPTDLSRDVEGQTAEVLTEIDRLLALAGSDKSKVVQATVWLNDIRNRDGMNKAWSAWLGGKDAPARACVEAKVIDPRMLVEISVVAVK